MRPHPPLATIGHFFLMMLVCHLLLSSLAAQSTDSAHDPNDYRVHDHQADQRDVENSDKRLFAAAIKHGISLSKIEIDSQVDPLKIPAYLFSPKRVAQQDHPALVWVYGGIHDRFGVNYFPFILQAVKKGYIVIAPEYRGASGYGQAYYDAIDYGGYEVNDIVAAGNYLASSVDAVDPDRIGVIGFSHGGYIALLAVMREDHPFACAATFVPVCNLVFRLAYKGPQYQRLFVEQKRIGGLPHEKRKVYIDRSPVYHVDQLQIPLHVQLATNDRDVEFFESEMLANALRAKKPNLSEVVVFEDPENGHYFNRQVDLAKLIRKDTEVQIDSWKRTWAFFKQNLE